MRACVLDGVRSFRVADIPAPEMGSDDVLVRVGAVGLCGTDYHIYIGEANYTSDENGKPIPLEQRPQVLGHEIAGIVEAVGRNVKDLRAGDTVALDQGLNCMSTKRSPLCEYCATGDSHQCEFYREHGITGLQGGLAEFVALPAVNAIRVQTGLDFSQAVMTEPLACVVHSMAMATGADARYRFNASEAERRVKHVLVLGAGPAGLLFTQYIRKVLGFDGVLVVSEPNPTKRALAAQFGADVVDPRGTGIVDAIRERTAGRMVQFVVESSGAGAVFPILPALIRKQASILLYGHGHGGVDMSALNSLQFKEPTLLSPVGASGAFDEDGRPAVYKRALSLIEEGTIRVAPIVSHTYSALEDVGRAFSHEYTQPDYTKGVVRLA